MSESNVSSEVKEVNNQEMEEKMAQKVEVTVGDIQVFVNIIDLSLKCNGPVFIFSNWLQFGVESLSILLDACGFKKFPEPPGKTGMRYFVWSSETSTDKELIRQAKSAYNSISSFPIKLLYSFLKFFCSFI